MLVNGISWRIKTEDLSVLSLTACVMYINFTSNILLYILHSGWEILATKKSTLNHINQNTVVGFIK